MSGDSGVPCMSGDSGVGEFNKMAWTVRRG